MAAVKVLVEIDGVAVPLEDCEWVWFHACGCPLACAKPDSADEDAMWADAFGSKREVDVRRRRGVTSELMTRTRFAEDIMPMMRASYQCPHEIAVSAS